MSDTARLLADSVDTFLARHAEATEAELLAALQSSGFAMALASEDHGGLACSWSEAAIVARLWGYHAAPLPIVEMLMAGQIASAAADPDLAPSLAVASMSSGDGQTAIAAHHAGQRFCLAAREGAVVAFPIPMESGEIATTIASEPYRRIPFPTDGTASFSRPLPPHSEILRRGTILTTARMLGAMDRIVEIIIEHAKLRTQFGRPLAKFQLVQTLISDAASEVDATRAALERALLFLDRAWDDDLAWYAAKGQAARAATLVAANAHQLMGAIGFTQEHVLHAYTRRLWAWRDAWLSQTGAEEALGRRACEAGGGRLWSLLADMPGPAFASEND